MPQQEAIKRVGTAFAEDPSANLTPEQQTAFQTVRQEFSPTPFTIETPDVLPSTDLAPTTTSLSDIDRRTQDLRVEAERVMAEQDARATQLEGLMQPGEDEATAQRRLMDITQQERGLEHDYRRQIEGVEDRPGISLAAMQRERAALSRQANRELADVAIQKLAASEELQALTGQRLTALDTLKARMGFEDTRLDKILGLEKEFRAMDAEARAESREFIALALEFSQGLTWDQIGAATQQEIRNNLANLPITEDMIKQALELNQLAALEEMRKQGLDEVAQMALIEQRMASAQASLASADASYALADQRRTRTYLDMYDDLYGDESQYLPFEEWKQTENAQELLRQAQENEQMSFSPEKADEYLRSIYDEAMHQQPGLEHISSTERASLERAGLLSADTSTQTYFLSAEAEFRTHFAQRVAMGDIPRNATMDQIWEEYQNWKALGKALGGAGGETDWEQFFEE